MSDWNRPDPRSIFAPGNLPALADSTLAGIARGRAGEPAEVITAARAILATRTRTGRTRPLSFRPGTSTA